MFKRLVCLYFICNYSIYYGLATPTFTKLPISITNLSLNRDSLQKSETKIIPIANLPEKLQILLKEPREKIEINGLKPYYISGETIDLQIFTRKISTNTKSEISNTLYLDFIDLDKGILLKHFTVRLVEGKASIKFYLKNDLVTGNYLIRSYTNWMRNFSENEFFNQKTTIFSQNYQKELSEITSTKTYLDTIKVFAEGNKLVEGVNTKVIIKAINSLGNPYQTSFQLKASSGNTLIHGETDSIGMAYFDLTPSSTINYQIHSENKIFPFPNIQMNGSTFKIDNLNSNDKLKVLLQNVWSENRSDTLHLLVLKESDVLFNQSLINNMNNAMKLSH